MPHSPPLLNQYYFETPKSHLQGLIDSVFAYYPEVRLPEEDTFFNRPDRFSFVCYLVDTSGPEIYYVDYYGNEYYWEKHPDLTKLVVTYMGLYPPGERGDDSMPLSEEPSPEERNRRLTKFESRFLEKLKRYIEPLPDGMVKPESR